MSLRLVVLLTAFIFASVKSSVGNLDIKCIKCITYDDGSFTLAEGNNLIIQYSIKATIFFNIKVGYDKQLLFEVGLYGKIYFLSLPRWRIPFAVTKYLDSSAFDITLFNVSLADAHHKLHYTNTFANGGEITGSHTIHVMSPPKFTNDLILKDSYPIEEDTELPIYFSMSGNPKPNVSVTFDGARINFTSTLIKQYTHKITFLFKNTSGLNCGKKIKIYAVGYRNMQAGKTIDLFYSPKAPHHITVRLNVDRCLDVRWDKIETGMCNVSYNIMYVYHDDLNVSFHLTAKHEYIDCHMNNTSLSYVLLQSVVNKQASNFSNPIYINPYRKRFKTIFNNNTYITIGFAILVALVSLSILILLIIQRRRSESVDKPNHDDIVPYYSVIEEPNVNAFGRMISEPIYEAVGSFNQTNVNSVSSTENYNYITPEYNYAEEYRFRNLYV